MRKRRKAGASEAVASSSGSEAAEEELFAAEQRLGGDHPAAEPAWSDEEDLLSEADEDGSEVSGSDREKEMGTDADSGASSAVEDSPSDDDELDTAIVELAAGRDAEDAEANPLMATYVFKFTRFPCASHLQHAFFAVVCLRSQHSQRISFVTAASISMSGWMGTSSLCLSCIVSLQSCWRPCWGAANRCGVGII